MLYLGTSPAEPDVRLLLHQHRIGLMCQPASNKPRAGWLWAGDNGLGPAPDGTVPEFTPKKEARWLDWLRKDHPRSGCLFAVVPDVVANHDETMKRWDKYAWMVRDLSYPVAFACQNGATVDTIPWAEFDTLFVGGSTEWKMSTAFGLAGAARDRGKWIHVGRINSNSRYQAWAPFADSCDGTVLAFGPKTNTPRLTGWLDTLEREPTLWGQR